MQLLQIVPSLGRSCGIALFADALAGALAPLGIGARNAAELADGATADIVLLHHHPELIDDAAVLALCNRSQPPIALFAHDSAVAGLASRFAGAAAMAPGLLPEGLANVHVFPHPALVPDRLEERARLRERLGLPAARRVVGTSGFLKFDRQYAEIAERLLPQAHRLGWLIQVLASPWYLDSPGVADALTRLERDYPDNFVFEYRYLDDKELNLRLQACDLLWCWTRAPSARYASGVVSTHYASGTRVCAAAKLQHEHVLALPNVVRAPDSLDAFVERLIAEAGSANVAARHDPAPVSWATQAPATAQWLRKTAENGSAG